MLKITNAQYLNDYTIKVDFSDNSSGTVDLKERILKDARPIFAPLKDINIFKQFTVAHDTLCWPNELDLAPEYLYFLAFRKKPEYQNQFIQWGYLNDSGGENNTYVR